MDGSQPIPPVGPMMTKVVERAEARRSYDPHLYDAVSRIGVFDLYFVVEAVLSELEDASDGG